MPYLMQERGQVGVARQLDVELPGSVRVRSRELYRAALLLVILCPWIFYLATAKRSDGLRHGAVSVPLTAGYAVQVHERAVAVERDILERLQDSILCLLAVLAAEVLSRRWPRFYWRHRRLVQEWGCLTSRGVE